MLSVRYRQVQAREDRRAALSAMLLANVHRDSDTRPTPFTLEEVTSWLGHGFQQQEPAPGPAVQPTQGDLLERVQMLNALYNGQRMDN